MYAGMNNICCGPRCVLQITTLSPNLPETMETWACSSVLERHDQDIHHQLLSFHSVECKREYETAKYSEFIEGYNSYMRFSASRYGPKVICTDVNMKTGAVTDIFNIQTVNGIGDAEATPKETRKQRKKTKKNKKEEEQILSSRNTTIQEVELPDKSTFIITRQQVNHTKDKGSTTKSARAAEKKKARMDKRKGVPSKS